MPEPGDSAQTLLSTQSAALREMYHEGYWAQTSRFGQAENKLITLSKRQVNSTGLTIQANDRKLYGARFTSGPYGDNPQPKTFGSANYKVTMGEGEVGSSNAGDFRWLKIQNRVGLLDLERAASTEASAVDFIAETEKQSSGNIAEKMAMHWHLDSTGRLGTASATPKKADNRFFASCSAIGTTGGGRVTIANGSIAYFQQGMQLSVYNGNTFIRNIEVIAPNPADNSFAFYGLDSSGNRSSSVNVNDVLNGYSFYFSGEKGLSPISGASWFASPTAGESFYTRDRSTPEYDWMRPHISGPQTAAETLSKSHLDAAAIQMGYKTADPSMNAYIVLTTMELEQRYRNEIGNDIIVQFPTDDQRGKLLAQSGFDGSIYRHPNVGRFSFQTSPLAPLNKIRYFRLGDWERLVPSGIGGFRWIPRGEMGSWYSMESTTPGNGKTIVYAQDGLAAYADICLNPGAQVEIQNVTGVTATST